MLSTATLEQFSGLTQAGGAAIVRRV